MSLPIENEKELISVLKQVTSHLFAAHSLLKSGGKKAAGSDKMFYMMLDDYEKTYNLGIQTIIKNGG